MTIIPFEEVAQGAETEQERIHAKEAIYRGLIEDLARIEGRPFEEVLETMRTQDAARDIKQAALLERMSIRRGLSAKEVSLDLNIGGLTLWNKTFAPHYSGFPKTEPA